MDDLNKIIETLKQLNIPVKNADNSFRTFQEVVLDLDKVFDGLDKEQKEKASSAIVTYGYITIKNTK